MLEHEDTGSENSFQNLLVCLEGSFDLGTITRGPVDCGMQYKDILSQKGGSCAGHSLPWVLQRT